MNEYVFLVRLKEDVGGGEVHRRVRSKHLQGAIRKLYQTYEFDTIVKIYTHF